MLDSIFNIAPECLDLLVMLRHGEDDANHASKNDREKGHGLTKLLGVDLVVLEGMLNLSSQPLYDFGFLFRVHDSPE